MQNDGSIVVGNYGSSTNNFDDASPIKQFFRSKWVRLILVIDVIAIVAVIAILVNNTTKTAIINFNVAPVDAKIQLNGQGDYSNGTYQIHPGTYEVTISHNGLESKTLSLELQSEYDTTLATFLKGEGDNFDFYILKDNFDSFQKLASIASNSNNQTIDHDTSAEEFIADYQRSYNAYKNDLPMSYNDTKTTILSDGSPWYSVVSSFDIRANNDDECRKTICLDAIMRAGSNQSTIDEFLKEKGFNLKYCEVIYEVPYPES